MGHNLEKCLRRYLKRKAKISLGFVVSFLITGTIGYSEIIDKTVEIKIEEGQTIITPDTAGKLEENTWIHYDTINVQNGNGVSIIVKNKEFNFINNGTITGKNENEWLSGNGIYNSEKSIIKSLENKGLISGESKIDEGEDNYSGNGICNFVGEITNLENNGIITGKSENKNEKGAGNGIYNYNGTIADLTNNGVILGESEDGNNFRLGNGIYNEKSEIANLMNNGIIAGNGDGRWSNNGIYNSYGTIINLANNGVILGNSKNKNESGNGIYTYGTIQTLINNGIISGNNGIYNENSKIANLMNNGIIAGSNKAIDGTGTNNIINNGLLINEAETENMKIEAGKGGKIENSQSEYYGYMVKNGEITDNKTKNILASSMGENADKYIFNLVDSSFIVDKDFVLTNGIINRYQNNETGSTVQIDGEIIFKAENVTFNGMNGNDNVVIKGNDESNTVVLAGKIQINGKIDLAGTNDKDKLFFEKSLNSNNRADNNEEVYIHHDINGAEKITFNNNVTLFETAKIIGAEKIYIGDGGQLTLRVDCFKTNNNKVIGHGLYGQEGTIISSNENGKLSINFIGGKNENVISFGNNKLGNIVVGFTNPLFFADSKGKNFVSEIIVSTNKDLNDVIGTPDSSKKKLDISLYNKLNKIYKSMYSIDGLLGSEFANLTAEKTGEFLKYLHDIYAGNPYAYSSELSRKTMGMMRNLVDKDLNPELNKWTIYGGFTHTDSGTENSYYGKGYYSYDIGSRNISADTKITGGYFKTEYGKSDTVTTGIIFGGNNSETEIGASKVEGDSFYFGAYAKKYLNNFRFTLGAGFQHGDYKADRTATGYEGIIDTRKYSENYNDRGFDIYGDIKYSKEIGNNLFFEPSFMLSHTYLDQDGAKDESGVLAIETDSKNFDYASGELNLDLRKEIKKDKFTHSLTAGVSYEKMLSGYDEEYITGRVKGGTDFDILVPEKDIFSLNAKYELETEKGILFDVKGSYKFKHDTNQNEWIVGTGIGYRF